MHILLTPEAIQEYGGAHELGDLDVAELDAAAFVLKGTESGQPTVLLVSIDEEGRRALTLVTLNMLIALTGAMRARAEMEGWVQPL